MKPAYLGDSYDIVKRFWSESLRSVAPLYAHPRFVRPEIQTQYTAVTSILILSSTPEKPFGILLDPNTGIPLPEKQLNDATASYASLPFLVSTNAQFHPDYMICFDQSHHRRHKLSKRAQRDTKRKFLRESGIFSFYYVSHAPFLFMAQEGEALAAISHRLTSLGLPATRFEPDNAGGA